MASQRTQHMDEMNGRTYLPPSPGFAPSTDLYLMLEAFEPRQEPRAGMTLAQPWRGEQSHQNEPHWGTDSHAQEEQILLPTISEFEQERRARLALPLPTLHRARRAEPMVYHINRLPLLVPGLPYDNNPYQSTRSLISLYNTTDHATEQASLLGLTTDMARARVDQPRRKPDPHAAQKQIELPSPMLQTASRVDSFLGGTSRDLARQRGAHCPYVPPNQAEEQRTAPDSPDSVCQDFQGAGALVEFSQRLVNHDAAQQQHVPPPGSWRQHEGLPMPPPASWTQYGGLPIVRPQNAPAGTEADFLCDRCDSTQRYCRCGSALRHKFS